LGRDETAEEPGQTSRVAYPDGAVVVAVLLACVMGAQLPKHAIAFRLTPDVIGITAIWLVGLLLTQKAVRKPALA
jgi:cation:H+ antiporter